MDAKAEDTNTMTILKWDGVLEPSEHERVELKVDDLLTDETGMTA